jgi:fatty acid desaturase
MSKHPLKEQNMLSNLGKKDRILRVIVGLILIGLTLIGTIGVWGWLGLVLIVTALVGFCPVYTFLGVNSFGQK